MSELPKYISNERPQDNRTLALLAYLIVSNNQIYNYQLYIVYDYFKTIGQDKADSFLDEILDDKECQVTYESSLSAFHSEKEEIRKTMYYLLVVISSIDNTIDKNEEKVINDVESTADLDILDLKSIKNAAIEDAKLFRANYNTIIDYNYNKSEENWIQKIVRWFTKLFRKEDPAYKIYGFNPDDTDYKVAIEQCSVEAEEDFIYLTPIYENIIDSCNRILDEIKLYKNSFSLDTDYSAEMVNMISVFVDMLDEKVLKQCEEAQKSLEQKRRSVPDFTISILGRTKAGKSTLFTVLTNQDKEKIGKGNQRTTRYNRVYQWNLIRLIDTPGIGAAEAAGRSDEMIAESVLGETDIVCVVVADDTIQKDILDLLEKIADLNKPIIILLNHKENLEVDVKYQEFLKHPREWLTTKGETSLDGHINRIKRYADSNGFGHLLKIYPVFLLPAFMSLKDKYKDNKKLLWDSSNVDNFVFQLKKWIIDFGTIKKNQTILDEAIQLFDRSLGKITEAEEVLICQRNKNTEQKENRISQLNEMENEICYNVNLLLTERFDDLAKHDALIFAEEEVNRRSKKPEKEWSGYVKRINFEDDIKQIINKEVQLYADKVNDIIISFFDDFHFTMESIITTEIDMPVLFNFKFVTKFLGSVTSAIGAAILFFLESTNPAGWILAITGTALGLGSNLFDSKDQNKQKAINKIYETIKDNVLENTPEIVEKILEELRSNLKSNTQKILSLLQEFENGIDKELYLSYKLKNEYVSQIGKLNKMYAFKILKFLNSKANSPVSILPQDILSVDRTKSNSITIKINKDININQSDLDGIIAENITIERI